ncbi:MAG: hypothetical protein QF464_11885, partial [Myxococcota bacterium]|nr:hypothetical protein [Myxococcota bacterium]
IEAQEISFELLERNVAEASLGERIEAVLGDIRTTDAMGDRRFDLVTGTPPFMPMGSGTMPADPQRAAARFELRGGIEAYCEVAARHLRPGGALSLVMDAERSERYERAIADVGLHLGQVVTVLAREAGPARYLVYRAGTEAGAVTRRTLAVRSADGSWTADFAEIRARLGLVGA